VIILALYAAVVDDGAFRRCPSRRQSHMASALRNAAARTIEAVCAAIGQLLGAFPPQECANYFTNAG
jgi:hypothetical protein